MLIKEKDSEIYHLENEALSIWINAADGMNLYRLRYKDTEVISDQKERQAAGTTYGIPILFPTPNRTKNSVFIFEGKEYPAKIHGIARKAPFWITEFKEDKTGAYLEACLKITERDPLFQEYPFLYMLKIKIALKGQKLHYIYEVINEGNCNMPFGFGLHPFFSRLSDSDSVSVQGKSVMEKDKNKIPTGRLISVVNTPYDLLEGQKINNLDLDDVYTDLKGDKKAVVSYPDFRIDITADPSFSHMVVYTPDKENFFCVEPQTCSTDAINLYEHGEKRKAGLIILPPDESKTGEVIFGFD